MKLLADPPNAMGRDNLRTGKPFIARAQSGVGLDRKKSILLVEDNPEILELLTFFLHRSGFMVFPCRSANEAVEQAQDESEIDLLIADIRLGRGISGRELARQLCAQKPELDVIYISDARVELEDPEHFRHGVNYLPKPFDPTVLAKLALHTIGLTSQRERSRSMSGRA